MVIIHKNCDKILANDRSLPINSYLVTYIMEQKKMYDVVQASSFVEVFDNYYDQYGKGSIQGIEWTSGRVNPKVYNYKPKESKKKK